MIREAFGEARPSLPYNLPELSPHLSHLLSHLLSPHLSPASPDRRRQAVEPIPIQDDLPVSRAGEEKGGEEPARGDRGQDQRRT